MAFSVPTRLAVAAPLLAAAPLIASLPGAEPDSGVTRAVTLTSTVDVSGAEGFLFNPDDHSPVNTMATGILPTAYGDPTSMYPSSTEEFSHSLPAMAALQFGLLGDLQHIGQLPITP